MTRFRNILINKNFFFLWIGQIISQFGDRLNQMALIALVYHKSPGSTMELAKLILFIVIPVFLIGPVAGVYVDRWNRKHVMIASDVLRGFVVLLIPFFIIYAKTNLPIYLVVFVLYSITRFFLPSKMAIIPNIVNREELLAANSLSDTTRMIATIIGLGVAGILVKWIGVLGSFYIDSATFFISAALLSTITLKQAGHRLKDDFLVAEKAFKDAIKKSIFKDIKEGFEYLVSMKKMRFVVSIYFLLMSGIGAAFCVVIVFIQQSFGNITSDLGMLGMFLGIGLFAGAMIYGRFGHYLSKSSAIFISLAVSGLGIIAFTVLVYKLSSIVIASVCSFIIGMFISPIAVSSNTLVHEALPDNARGRVFSSLEAVMHIGFMVCMLLASFLADIIGRHWILIFVGCIFFIFGLRGLFFEGKKIRGNLL